jgi:hypothetical protein
MIGLGLKFLFVIAALCIILLYAIPSQYQSTNGSSKSSMNQTDSNTITNQSVALDKNQTKNQIPNSTIGIAKPPQNKTNQNSNLSSAPPPQAISNLVITNPDQTEQPQENQVVQPSQLPIPQSLAQPVQEPEAFSLPLYQQEPSIIQTQLALPEMSPLLSAYHQVPSFVQLLQNLPSFVSTYPEAPSLIQSQLLLQSIPLESTLQPLYYPVNTLAPLPVLQPEIIVDPITISTRILGYNSYVYGSGDLHIVGEVFNESFQTLRFVDVIATFYDANNRIIGTDFDFTNPSAIQPGQRAPFDIVVSEGSIPISLMAYYNLSVDYLGFD